MTWLNLLDAYAEKDYSSGWLVLTVRRAVCLDYRFLISLLHCSRLILFHNLEEIIA